MFANSIVPVWLWGFFVACVLVALWVDFAALKKQGAQAVSVPEALRWSLVWVALSLAFNGLLWWALSRHPDPAVAAQAGSRALEFLTGYLIEKSLAVDNIFVFLMIFGAFAVPPAQQKRLLMMGVVGAIVLRTLMIMAGAWLMAEFHWTLYVFGALLLFTGLKMGWSAGDSEEADIQDNLALKLLRKVLPVSPTLDGDRLWTRIDGRRVATPLLMVVLLVGLTDVIFAVDSIPAIFAVTRDPFIVLTSNIFAVLGLRAMFFLLAAMADKFHLLNYGLAVILVFIGAKMLLVDMVKIPPLTSLGVVVGILAVTMVWSLRTAPRSAQEGSRKTSD